MIITNHLNVSQAAQVAHLETLCKQYEPLQGSIFVCDELNFTSELPCFYLLYHPENKNELIAFLSIFAPSPEEAEIYAFTAPSWRRQGCFNVLLEAALHTLWEFHIDDILFVYEPVSANASAVLDILDVRYQYSEYFMVLPQAHIFSDIALPDELLLLPASESELDRLTDVHALAFEEATALSHEFLSEVFLSGSQMRKLVQKSTEELIGICCFSIGRNEISISGVAVHPMHRKKGYAAAMLKALISELYAAYPQHQLTLEVTSRNTAALSLYQKLGFQITSQFDYSLADCGELLDAF